MSDFKTLRVRKVEHHEDDAITVHFKPPLFNKVQYDAGQFLTFKLQIHGKQVFRSYSLCSAPKIDKYLSVTIKRVKDGYISNYLNNYLKVGDAVPASISHSPFRYIPKTSSIKKLVLIAAGSGITPMLSIIKTALYLDDDVQVHLFLGNRHQASILHKSELHALSAQFPNRFNLVHVLSQADETWQGHKGRLDERTLAQLLSEFQLAQDLTHTAFYLCGPTGMMESCLTEIKSRQVAEDKIYIESFSGLINKDSSSKPELGSHIVKLTLKGETHAVPVANGQSVLDAALAMGLDVTYSCRSGFCSACQCKQVKGQLTLLDDQSLTKKEQQQGKTLLCVGFAGSDDIQLTMD